METFAKAVYWQFSEEKIRMAKIHMKRCLTSLVEQCKLKPQRDAILLVQENCKRLIIASIDPDMGKCIFSYAAGRNINGYIMFGGQFSAPFHTCTNLYYRSADSSILRCVQRYSLHIACKKRKHRRKQPKGPLVVTEQLNELQQSDKAMQS